jgi:S1-C subfamily serine protease
MNNWCLVLLSTMALIAVPMVHAQADELGQSLAKLAKESEGHVVPVEFTARISLEGLPGINSKDNERNLRGTACGVVVSRGDKDKQYVIVATTALTPGTRVFEMMGATARIRWVRFLVNTGGGVKIGANVVNSSAELGLSLLRLDKPSDVLKPVTFAAVKTQLGDRVALVHTGPQILGSPRLFTVSRVAGEATKPRVLTLLSPAVPQANGALAFLLKKDGQAAVLGVHAALSLPSLPAEKNSVGQRTFESEEVAAAARGYLLPAEEIAQWIKKSKEKVINRPKANSAQAWLGVEVQVITEELATALGIDYDGVAKIKKVYPESPAAKAGLKVDDIIIELDEESLEMAENESMRDLVRDLGVGTEVALAVLRGGKKQALTVKLESSPPSPETVPRFPCHAHGLVFRDQTFFDKGLIADKKGLVVSKIAPKGSARLAGLKVYDVIVEINGQEVDKVELGRTLVQAGQSLAVKVWRKGSEKAINLRIQVN